MNFAICPEGGLPRLFRFDIDDDRILSELDVTNNILHINRYLFGMLYDYQQQEVFKTHSKILRVDHLM